MKVIIGLSRPHKFKIFAELIKVFLGTDYSHCYLSYKDPFTGQALIAETSRGESHLITADNWKILNARVDEFELEVSEDLFKLMMIHINNSLQTHYSIRNIFGIPFYSLYEITNLKFFRGIANLFADKKNGLICSEAVAFLLQMKGEEFEKPLDFITPRDIYHRLIKLSGENKSRQIWGR